jgi:hypothetical protein
MAPGGKKGQQVNHVVKRALPYWDGLNGIGQFGSSLHALLLGEATSPIQRWGHDRWDLENRGFNELPISRANFIRAVGARPSSARQAPE